MYVGVLIFELQIYLSLVNAKPSMSCYALIQPNMVKNVGLDVEAAMTKWSIITDRLTADQKGLVNPKSHDRIESSILEVVFNTSTEKRSSQMYLIKIAFHFTIKENQTPVVWPVNLLLSKESSN